MEVEIDLKKSIEENASNYFNKSKKARKKLEGIRKAIKETEKKIKSVEDMIAVEKPRTRFKKRKKKWFEKFHWFFSSDNFLVIAGKDAESNEKVVKKHLLENDLYFHAEIFGAPHCVLKTEGKKVSEKTLKEAAQFAAVFSKAWQEKLPAVDVYSVTQEQVSKKSPSGESLSTGAFMIYGKRNWFRKTPLKFSIGLKKENNELVVVSGPKDAVKKHAFFSVELKQGSEKKGVVAKKLKKLFEEKTRREISLDEIVAMLPTGGIEIVKQRN